MPTYDLSNAGGGAASLVQRSSPYDMGDAGELTQQTAGLLLVPNTEGGVQPTPHRTKYLKLPGSGYARQRISATMTGRTANQNQIWLRTETAVGGIAVDLTVDRIIINRYGTGDAPSSTAENVALASTFNFNPWTDNVDVTLVAEIREVSTTGCVVKAHAYRVSNGQPIGVVEDTSIAVSQFASASVGAINCGNVAGAGVAFKSVTETQITGSFFLDGANAACTSTFLYKGTKPDGTAFKGPHLQFNFARYDGHTSDLTITPLAYDGSALPTGISVEILDSNFAAKSTFTSADTTCYIRISASAAATETGINGAFMILRVTDGVTTYDEVIIYRVYALTSMSANTLNCRAWDSSSMSSGTQGAADEIATAYSGYIGGTGAWAGTFATDAIGGTNYTTWGRGSTSLLTHIYNCIKNHAASVSTPIGSNNISVLTTWAADHKTPMKRIVQDIAEALPLVVLLPLGARFDGATTGATGTISSIAGDRLSVVLSAEFSAVDDAYNNLPLRFTGSDGLYYFAIVTDYIGASKTAILDSALPALPAAGDACSSLTSNKYASVTDWNAGISTFGDSAHADYITGVIYVDTGYQLPSRYEMQTDSTHQASPQNTLRDYWRDGFRAGFQRRLQGSLTPSTVTLLPSATQAFSASVNALLINPNATGVPSALSGATWSADSGTIDSDGDPYTAPGSPGSDTVRYTFDYGGNEFTADVTVNAPGSPATGISPGAALSNVNKGFIYSGTRIF